MKIAIVAPSPVPYVIGGAENLWWGMLRELNSREGVEAELIKIPSPERNLLEILGSYRAFAELNLDHFDMVVSTKYPAWMLRHHNHMVYLQHTLRGLYDTYPPDSPTALAPAALDGLDLPPAVADALLGSDAVSLEAVEVIDAMLLARRRCDNWNSLAALPGPFSRAVVHLLDRIGMQQGRIRRYAAIAGEVAGRNDYFPANCCVEVFHHPTHLQDDTATRATGTGFAEEGIFTASRLVPEKRIDLIIDAYRASKLRMPLRIAGSGPQEQALRDRARGLDGVHFLGRLTDDQLCEQYRAAAFVPFVPLKEDYGLITVEAMGFGKPVLTTVDSGGPTEVVEHGVTGMVVEPNAAGLGQAMKRMAEDEAGRGRMGAAARSRAHALNWRAFGDWLLRDAQPIMSSGSWQGSAPTFPYAASGAGSRPRVLVVNTFSVFPPVSGGQLRMMGLYAKLSQHCDVHLANLCTSVLAPETRRLAARLWEHVAPLSPAFLDKLKATEKAVGVSAVDLTAALNPELLPQWLDIISREAGKSDLLICSHPYGHPAMTVAAPGRAYVYEAHNVEYDLKAGMYGTNTHAAEDIRRIEERCAQSAAGVAACTPHDAQRMSALYGLDGPSVEVIPNGIDLQETKRVRDSSKLAAAARFGKRGRIALFMGSAHTPNIEALNVIALAAALLPDVSFVIMGSVCYAAPDRLPANVALLGVVSDHEKHIWLTLADVGLNPVVSGSGTNLKTLEYVASGVLMISTRRGVRGTDMDESEDYLAVDEAAPADGLVAALKQHAALRGPERARIARSAYEKIAATASWDVIGQRYATFSLGFLRT